MIGASRHRPAGGMPNGRTWGGRSKSPMNLRHPGERGTFVKPLLLPWRRPGPGWEGRGKSLRCFAQLDPGLRRGGGFDGMLRTSLPPAAAPVLHASVRAIPTPIHLTAGSPRSLHRRHPRASPSVGCDFSATLRAIGTARVTPAGCDFRDFWRDFPHHPADGKIVVEYGHRPRQRHARHTSPRTPASTGAQDHASRKPLFRKTFGSGTRRNPNIPPQARASATPLELWRSAVSTVSTIAAASSPASAYCTSGLSWS